MSTQTPDGVATRPDTDVERIAAAIVKVVRLSTHLAQARSGGTDRGAFFVLAVLTELGPQRSSVLAERVHADPSTVSRQIAGLVKLGFVERRADPVDGRASVLAATESGMARIRRGRLLRSRMINDLLAHWEPDEIQALARLLPKLASDYESRLPELLARLNDADLTSTDPGEGPTT